jgi:hypothetical protein
MQQYPTVRRLDDDRSLDVFDAPQSSLHAAEKLDGANFRFTLQRNLDPEYHDPDRRLAFGSRNVAFKHERDLAKAFEHAATFVREHVDVDALIELDDADGPLTVFGEVMHPHTLDYDWDDVPSFLGFDVYAAEPDAFYAPREARDAFDRLGLPTVPTFDVDDVLVDGDVVVPDSEYRDGPAEGVVFTHVETGARAKARSDAFEEVREAPAESATEDRTDADRLADRYATEARVRKLVHKYEDAGRDVDMTAMDDLWRDVFDDIVAEESHGIFHEDHVIDTDAFRSAVADRTATHLQQYLRRQ